MTWTRTIALLAGAAALAAAARRRRDHARHADQEVHRRLGGQDERIDEVFTHGSGLHSARAYDVMSRLLLGGLFRRIAADVAAVARSGGPPRAAEAPRVLEVGCGPGHLAGLLAQEHGLDVLGVDLDPAMVERARLRAAARRGRDGAGPSPRFEVADVAALPYPDASFDLVVSSFSLHHWANPGKGLAEIGRVLRPGGRALIWDFLPGRGPGARHRHGPQPDIAALVADTPLRLVDVSPWRWPGPLRRNQRIELVRAVPEHVTG